MGLIFSAFRRRPQETEKFAIVPRNYSPLLKNFTKAKPMMVLEVLSWLELEEIAKVCLLSK